MVSSWGCLILLLQGDSENDDRVVGFHNPSLESFQDAVSTLYFFPVSPLGTFEEIQCGFVSFYGLVTMRPDSAKV